MAACSVVFDAFGAREQAARRDADVDEGVVVRASVERRRLAGEALRVEVVNEYVFDDAGARRAERGGVGGVAVVDEPDVVRGADHVEVQVDGDVLEFASS